MEMHPKKMKRFSLKFKQKKMNEIFKMWFILIINLIIILKTNEAKDLIHNRLRNLSPENLFGPYSEIPLTTNTNFSEFESSIFSWSGAKLNPKNLQILEGKQFQIQQEPQSELESETDSARGRARGKEARNQNYQHHEYQQQHLEFSSKTTSGKSEEGAAPAATPLLATRRKTKSGLLIESNIENDFTQNIDSHDSANVERRPNLEADFEHDYESFASNSAPTSDPPTALINNDGGRTAKTNILFSSTNNSNNNNNFNQHHQQQQQHHKNNKHKNNNNNSHSNSNSNSNKRKNKLQQRNNQHNLRNRNGRNHWQKNDKNDVRLRNSATKPLEGGGLYPPLFNVAPRAAITVNATCGQNGREEYCKLVDAYPHKKWATQCGICNAHSSDADKHRPIEAVISNKNIEENWWQSPTLEYGRHYEYVTITLDLKQMYQVFIIMIKSANSPRPASWILEKSLDGINFEPWQYFGVSDLDCRQRYGLPGQNGKYVFQNSTEVICTTQFSKALPLEKGEIHVSLMKNRPGAVEQSQDLLNFITARFIRIRLQGMHTTANLDNSVDWLLDSHSMEKRSFYSLKQIKVSARLDCHGHADKTFEVVEKQKNTMDLANLESKLECVCQHNTCGTDCGQCCPLFQDKPFRNGSECEVCQCHGHAESCIYDLFLDRGICQDCQNHTAGTECEFCRSGFFRPIGASPIEACAPCVCNEVGSLGDCEAIGGACLCKEGFQGPQCDECSPGYYGADCRKCECDARGTLPNTECSGICQCKSYVGGDTCTTCQPGYFDLSSKNPDGCTPCWCSGVGLSCSSAPLQTLAFETLNDWKMTDIQRSQYAMPSLSSSSNILVCNMEELSSNSAMYWQAPRGYIGNRLTSYGSRLSMQVSWVTIRGDTSGKPTIGPNVILIGKNGMKIAFGNEDFDLISSTTINVTLSEEDWYHLPDVINETSPSFRGEPVSRFEFLSILANLDALLIRGTFHTDQLETALERAIIFSGGTELGGKPTTQVEQCTCPPGYIGLSCEGCDFGYIRIYENSTDSQLIAKCIPCPCNGHSNSCNLQSGGCGDCMHNTFGERCERCKVGFYGNPLQGNPDDCKRCACPLLVESNNFSPHCQLKTFTLVDVHAAFGLVENPAEYICTQCPVGYTGDHCEKCDDGFYGSPTTIGSNCKPCECDGGPCDVVTGECITCSGNTEGWHCERCKHGYWNDGNLEDPSSGCKPCDCYEFGSDHDVCDSADGQCLCKPRYSGQKCDRCDEGYTNVSEGCLPCNCDTFGSEDPEYCDPDNGQCLCKPGVAGLKCNECEDGYFGLEEFSNGCQECQCSSLGSISIVCEKRTGQCSCLANVTGRQCDKCKGGHWNLTQGIGCFNCNCDPYGSRGTECNPWTGQCDCKIGVGGRRCDECTDGFFGFSAEGCQRCAPCPGEGQVCDPINGRCICPPNSRGLGCAQCIPGTFGWQPRLGCQECSCDLVGSIGQFCNTNTGQCQCREGYTGRQCNMCAVGYFGYPECRRCNCDPNGSFVRPDGLIACDANGQCPCKSLVVGLKCDTCQQATFGLSSLNPEGCTRCYCFGRTSECEQSNWTWGHVRMSESRNLSVQYMRSQSIPNNEYEYIVVVQMEGSRTYQEDAEISLMNDLNLIPRSTGNISIGAYGIFYHPLYFQLQPQFYGDRTSSYGGNLYFTLITEGAEIPLERKVLSKFPLVQMHSHSRLVLDFFDYEHFEYTLNATYKVPLHETYWKFHHNSQTVDRASLMAALQNIKHIFLRGSTFADFKQVVLQNVHMDAAIYIHGSINMLATGVEKCRCPKRYDGLSCQDPGKGFYRWRNVTETETYFIEDLIGRAVPCHCNARSEECDRETGHCLFCRDNTGGAHCDQCAEGFYGDPNSPYGCQPCPCPETSRNFAKGCKVWEGEVSCICKPGYTGKLCDRCRPGYFGNPMDYPISTCMACNCNLDGIIKDGCDAKTGQCYCRPGVTGLKCDRCIAERHHVVDNGCRLCDTCTLLLMDEMEWIQNKLQRGLQNMDLNGIPAPYLKVEEFEDYFGILDERYQNFYNARRLIGSYNSADLAKLDSHAEHNKFQFRKSVSIAEKRKHAAGIVLNDARVFFKDMLALRSEILQNIHDLNNYGKTDRLMNLSTALEQALFYLDSIRQHQESVDQVRSTTKCAWDYFYSFGNISDVTFDQDVRVALLWRDLNQTNFRISDIGLNTERTFEMQNAIDDIQEHIKNIKQHLLEDNRKILEASNTIQKELSDNLLSETKTFVDTNYDLQTALAEKIKIIVKMSHMLNSTLNDNEELHREVRKHWLPKAQKHADRLMERSNEYARQFQPTRNAARIAMLASSAHSNISQAIEAARQSSFAAKQRANLAQETLYPTFGGSVIDRAHHSLQRSNILQRKALQQMNISKDLKTSLQAQEQQVEDIKNRILNAGIRTNNITSSMHNLGKTNTKNLALESIAMAEEISEEMKVEANNARNLRSDISHLKKKFAMLEPDWEIKLGLAEENISSTKTNIRLANISLSYVEEKSLKEHAVFEDWNDTMSDQLQMLKDKIAKARHAAEGIKISLESVGPKCIRSFLPTTYGLSTSNSIKISFALSNRNGNSPLLYVEGNDGKFIALELFKRHVRLVWNLGGRTTVITHPLEIQTRDPKYDDAWYHVEVNRTLNLGSLLVRRMNNYGSLVPSTIIMGSTDGEFTRFYQTTETRIYLGGYPPETRSIDISIPPGLNVVIHNVEVDSKPLGVWNFLSTTGRCGGAMIGAQESTSTSVARHFNGLGYAELRKTRPRPYRKNLFALQMTFKTLDENALLFLAVDNKNNRSVSVTLSRGRIMFRIDYGDESKLEINTTNKYNTGKWIKIEAAREFVPKRGTENGMLRVNNERPITGSPTIPVNIHMLPDLAKPIYYLGGVPPGFTSATTKAPGADNPFLGCMMDVQVNGESYDPLQSSSFYGIEPQCKEMITKAGFNGNGYIELPSQSLRKRANAGFVFRTLQSDCLLLLSAYPPEVENDYDARDIKGNYSISLIDGRIQVWVNSGKSFIKLNANATLNDGEFHVVNLIKVGRKLELIVDDNIEDTKSLAGTPTIVSMPKDTGGLYIGGAPPHHEYTPLAPTFINLEGSIRDVVFNNRTINFNQAIAFSNVQIGRNGPTMGTINGLYDLLLKTEPMIGKSFTAAPEGCLRGGSYSYEPYAFKFGDESNSYANILAPQRNYWQRNFNLTFDFRTFYPNGLIFLAQGSEKKPKHYTALILKDGHLLLAVRGRKREELQLTAKLNDGEWHHVTITCIERKVTMSVEIGRTDQKTSAQMKIPKRIVTSNPIIVGGLPETTLKVPSELFQRLEPFKGCLRKFTIGGTVQDLAKPGKHKNVGQCFPHVEKGSYFPGDAYAVYRNNFHVGKYLDLEMEFRTSEMNGILLSISEPSGFPALSLELFNGNIIFSCDLGDGVPFRVETLLPSKYALCDNKWHNISALYDYKQLALRIDQLTRTISEAPDPSSGKVQTKAPLYLGGIPDVAPSGSLMSRENFKGCLRNVSIRNEHRDWIDMDALHNVLISECLVTSDETK